MQISSWIIMKTHWQRAFLSGQLVVLSMMLVWLGVFWTWKFTSLLLGWMFTIAMVHSGRPLSKGFNIASHEVSRVGPWKHGNPGGMAGRDILGSDLTPTTFLQHSTDLSNTFSIGYSFAVSLGRLTFPALGSLDILSLDSHAPPAYGDLCSLSALRQTVSCPVGSLGFFPPTFSYAPSASVGGYRPASNLDSWGSFDP